ncbi:Rieske (2Fe-2S) protein [Neobacillus sp. NRS-1170]|uniref:Rieske (2Fe-2S) protein n=1 Tax=Neobacillus sp. NRS-1170 TaxID=3233898 RepID=UPI003D297CC8
MTWMRIAGAEEVEHVSEMKEIIIDNESLVLFHLQEGYYVTSNICTHRRQYLTEGSMDGGSVNCPRHGGKFDIKTGEPLAGPCFAPIQTFPVDIRNNEIWIDF